MDISFYLIVQLFTLFFYFLKLNCRFEIKFSSLEASLYGGNGMLGEAAYSTFTLI